jgi:hypothetical protein
MKVNTFPFSLNWALIIGLAILMLGAGWFSAIPLYLLALGFQMAVSFPFSS